MYELAYQIYWFFLVWSKADASSLLPLFYFIKQYGNKESHEYQKYCGIDKAPRITETRSGKTRDNYIESKVKYGGQSEADNNELLFVVGKEPRHCQKIPDYSRSECMKKGGTDES